MKRLLWLLALPYVVTVTDLPKDMVIADDNGNIIGSPWKYKNYHLTGFQDCVSSSTVQCDYMYDIAAGLNMAAEKREAK